MSTDDAACAVQIRAGNGHQADRANADDQHRVTELDVRLFHAVKACGHHVGEHAGLFRRNFVRHVGQIAVGVVDMEVFAKDAILEVGEFPARQHAAGVGAKTGLGLQGTPVRRDGGHHDAVALFEVFHQRTDFIHDPTALVPQDHVVPVAQGPFPYRVHWPCHRVLPGIFAPYRCPPP